MSKLSGDFEAVDQAHQLDMDYVSEHIQVVMTLPGTGVFKIISHIINMMTQCSHFNHKPQNTHLLH